jgi:subtilisin family serine protease
MDSGIDITHPDLKDNIWTNDKEIPGNGVDDDGNGYVDDVHGIATYGPGGADVGDDYFHGTHLAGIVGAACNNGVGGCGVAPGVRLMACKFLDARGNGYTSDAVRCLNYAVTNKADVTLNSYGGLAADSAALKAAIGAAQAAGQVFVAAAGNDYGLDVDATPTYPAAYDMPAVLAVAASDGGGRLANFSNYGAARVAIAAPGVAILSTVPGGKYERHDGTSQAAAQVAGGLALLLSARRRAGWGGATAMSVREELLAAARQVTNHDARLRASGKPVIRPDGTVARVAGALAPVPFQALMIADSGNAALRFLPPLARFGAAPGQVVILGTELWNNEPGLARVPALKGALYATVADARFNSLAVRYRTKHGGNPSRLASLGYDAVLLAHSLATRWPLNQPFPRAALLAPDGFAGIDGAFRFTPGRVAERALEVDQIGSGVVSPAPTSF